MVGRLSALSDTQWKRLEKLLALAEPKPTQPKEAAPDVRFQLCECTGATFLPEARVENLSAAPERIRLGEGTHVRGELLIFRFGGELEMGSYCYLGGNSRVWAGESVKIGDNVLISHDVFITDCNAHELDPDERAAGFRRIIEEGHPLEQGHVVTAPVTIENNVWINPQTVILPGVTLGRGSVIGCGSVVTKSIPPMVFAAGNPAVVIRSLT